MSDNYMTLLDGAERDFEHARKALGVLKEKTEAGEEVSIADFNDANEKATKYMEDGKAKQEAANQFAEIEKRMKDVKDQQQADIEKASRFGGQEAGFKHWGEYLISVKNGFQHGNRDPRLKSLVFRDVEEANAYTRVKDMSGQTGSGGGYLIPPEFREELMSVMVKKSIIRPRATIIPMRRRTVSIPVLDQSDKSALSAGMPRWYGGLIFYWADEGSTKTASDAEFKEVTLIAKKLIGFTRASDELLDDAAVSLEAFLGGELGFTGGAAWMEDYSFLNGTGGAQPLGVLNSPGILLQARDTADAIGYDTDLVGMCSKFLPSSGNGIWLASQSTIAKLLTMSGPSGNASYLWTGGTWGSEAVNGMPNNLLGYPIEFTEKAPALGAQGDLGLYDFSYYLIGDRQAPTIESTVFEAWANDKTSWRLVHRVDGAPWLDEPLTFQDETTQVSPFVILGANP